MHVGCGVLEKDAKVIRIVIFKNPFQKAVESQPRIMDIVVSFLPSPDSGEVSVVLIVPTYNNVDDHLPIPSYHSRSAYF